MVECLVFNKSAKRIEKVQVTYEMAKENETIELLMTLIVMSNCVLLLLIVSNIIFILSKK